MSATAGRHASSLPASIPLTQNTAPVFEYRCLFTHDVRRKGQKRWQDGYLKFHTFNNRVMVSDESRNFVGDTHYQSAGSSGLDDGDELKLDRCGVMVQVGEKVGKQDTDLTELLAKRVPKGVEGAENERDRTPLAWTPTLLQPRSTNAHLARMPARWSGWTGRAQIPKGFPFEQRQAAAAPAKQREQGPPEKRQRRDDEHVPLWELLKTSNASRPAMSPTNPTKDPMWPRTADARSNAKILSTMSSAKRSTPAGQRSLKIKEVIQIDSSAEDEHDDSRQAPTTASEHEHGGVYDSSPVKPQAEHQPKGPKSTEAQGADSRPTLNVEDLRRLRLGLVGNCHNPAKTTPSRARMSTARQKAAEQPSKITPNERDPPASPPVTTINRLPANARDTEPEVVQETETDASRKTLIAPQRPTKLLRLGSTAPRKVLLCQTLTAPDIRALAKRRSPSPAPVLRIDWPLNPPINPAVSLAEGIQSPTKQDDVIESSPAFEVMAERPLRSRHLSNHKEDLTINRLPCESLTEMQAPQKPVCAPEAATMPTKVPQQTFRHQPPDYSHLDAQFMPKAKCKPSSPPIRALETLHNGDVLSLHNLRPLIEAQSEPAALLKNALPTNLPLNEPIPNPLPQTTIPSIAASRTLRRVCSDTTHISLPKHAQAPPKRSELQRAETVTGVRGQQRAGTKVAGIVESALGVIEVIGPWTKEAWDLFGWCPDGKKEILGWMYTVDSTKT